MEKFFFEHITDLSEKCRASGSYVFSDFISPEELSVVKSHGRALESFAAFGGADGCERTMLRFGCEEELFYTEDFPIVCLRVKPLNYKFADALTHRDFLGALMSLSVERGKIGDIVVRENEAYIFAAEKIADFICENLTKVKHTDVSCAQCDTKLQGTLYTFEDKELLSSSARADCVISAAYGLSRSEANRLFASDKVFINSGVCENSSKTLEKGDRVSVRGFGKFIFCGETGKTKKERLKIKLSFYK